MAIATIGSVSNEGKNHTDDLELALSFDHFNVISDEANFVLNF